MKTNKRIFKTFVSMLLILSMITGVTCMQAVAVTKPATPSIYYAKSYSYNSALIKWTPVDDVDGYYLYRTTTNNKAWSLVATIKGGTTSSYKDTGLTCGTTYYYTIRAFVGSTKSDYNPGVGAKIVPATPKLVSAEPASTTAVNVKWSKVSGASGYYVYCSTESTSGSWSKIATVKGGSTVTYKHTGLTAGKAYCYTVRAYRTVNNTNVLGGYVTPGLYTRTTPSKPTLLSASPAYNSATVKWSKVNYATGYYVYRKTASTGWEQIATISSGDTLSYVDKNVKINNTYIYTVRAVISNSKGTWKSGYDSDGISVKILPSTPSLKSLVSPTYTKLTLTWGSVSGATGYRIYRKTSSSASWSTLATVKGTTTYTDTNLTCGKTYIYTVRAYRTVNDKTYWSGYKTNGISAMCKPKTPTLKSIIGISETSARITYEEVSGANGYYIYRKTGRSSWSKIATVKAKDITYYDDKNCKVGNSYTYTVRAFRNVNGSPVLSAYDTKGLTVKIDALSRVEKNYNLVHYQSVDYPTLKYLKGWLTIANTIVDFPVMQDPYDEMHFLRKDMYGNSDDNGCLILNSDCIVGDTITKKGNSIEESRSSNLIIYGHKRPESATSGMFRDLATDYNTTAAAKKHKTITLSTTAEVRKYSVISAFYDQVHEVNYKGFKYYDQYNFFTQSEFDYFYKNITKKSIIDTGVTASFGDEFITLSTCAWVDQNGKDLNFGYNENGENLGRFVVIAKRIS